VPTTGNTKQQEENRGTALHSQPISTPTRRGINNDVSEFQLQDRRQHMKGLILGLMCFASGLAHAGTVTLEPTNCLNAYYCTNVNNSANEPIEVITYNQHYGRLVVFIDNVVWDSGLWALLGQGTNLVNIPLYDGAAVIYVSVGFKGGQVTGPCVQQGHVCVYPHAPVSIVGGSIVSP
jgi:hypothetical protein